MAPQVPADAWRWVTTAPNPRHPGTGHDAGQRGWRLHLVEVGKVVSTIYERDYSPAVCGLRPTHGWGVDLFIDEECSRCVSIAQRQGIDLDAIDAAEDARQAAYRAQRSAQEEE